ncbi:MAG: hypothetical protein Q9227_004418 [Pyrenula ochraceoflavens]
MISSFRRASRAVSTAGRRRSKALIHSDAVTPKTLDSVLIANRGEIALRVSRTAKKHGLRVVTLYTDPDARAQHASVSPFSFNLGETKGYLDSDQIISVARQHHCKALHPGYGFLSENSEFARKCAENGVKFIGPPWKAIEDMGDKAKSKKIMERAGVPCVPGYHGSSQDQETLSREAEMIGYPVLIKAVRGGGGKGMRIAKTAEEFADMLVSAKSEARSSFGNDDVLVEKYITTPRHIEVQIFADEHRNCLALGERDCSIQRRHQKILEESPAPGLDFTVRRDLWEKARAAALAVGYVGAGTVEFIFDNDTGQFFFMEMNTRLQVEHPVTEMVTGLDLVHWQLLAAEGKMLPLTQEEVEEEIARKGHAIEARIYAENPTKGFIPDSGLLKHVRLPVQTCDVRVDTGFVQGDEVTAYYDPMISKLICRGGDRTESLRKLTLALETYEIAGPVTNIEFLKRVCTSPDFLAGKVETGYIEKHRDELFNLDKAPNEVLAQAALACYLSTQKSDDQHSFTSSEADWLLPDTSLGARTIELREVDTKETDTYRITVQPVMPSTFSVSVAQSDFQKVDIKASLDLSATTLHAFFPTTQFTSTIVLPTQNTTSPDLMILFSRGRQYRFSLPRPEWLARALGVKDSKNSVVAPMPCKVLRVDVRSGEEVQKDQSLLVIESMKMETTIRSPGNGRIKRVVHGEGEICKAGTALVEFEEDRKT